MSGGIRLATHLCILFNLFLVYSFLPGTGTDHSTIWSEWDDCMTSWSIAPSLVVSHLGPFL